jgi:hypothetical protein
VTTLEVCDRDEDHGLATHRITFASGATSCHLDFCQGCVDQITAQPLADIRATVTIEPIRSDGG